MQPNTQRPGSRGTSGAPGPARVLLPLPTHGVEASESGAPWKAITNAGHEVTFATPDGNPGRCDQSTLTGKGLGLVLGNLARADAPSAAAYREMERSPSFRNPIRWDAVNAEDFDAIVIPGGHHQDMRPFLESALLQAVIVELFQRDRIVAAICHGVLLPARSTGADGRSVLYGRRTAIVPGMVENLVWKLCHKRMGHERFGKPYDITAEEEVRAVLAHPRHLHVELPGPLRDAPGKENRGVCIVDGNYISARLPHDAWCFGQQVAKAISARSQRAVDQRKQTSS